MDKFLKQLSCQKGSPDATGAIKYQFSLDVLVPNAMAFAAGFCLEWFILDDIMFGGNK